MEIKIIDGTREQLQLQCRRLKREECDSNFTLHPHPSFSAWKKLIGESDWEDHSNSKEGAERYRVHNLPSFSSSGIYELGIALPRSDQVIAVYLGQADNVRTRLQHYGRTGAHLENKSLCVELNDLIQHRNRLFSEIFQKGCAIKYRWVPMKSKQEAEKVEAGLLSMYNYAWNKGNNGPRRHNDILKRLDEIASKDAKSISISRKIGNICHNQIGSKFDPNKPLLLENGSIIHNTQEINDVFSRIFKFGRSNPRRVTVTFDANNNCADICGVILGHGYVCTRPPVEGKKRCAVHKGMKINGLKSKLIVEHKSDEDPLHICGFTLENGYICTSQVVPGRKRCEEHKGKKSKPKTENSKNLSEKTIQVGAICGLNLVDGTFCSNQAVIGRKRCEEHKGRKIKHQFVHSTISSSSDTLKSEISKNKTMEVGSICGVKLEDDTICEMKPVEGRKRCSQHKGMRVCKDGYPGTSTYRYDDTIASFGVCGAGLGNGSICRRAPVNGRKRCEQHKGLRVNSEGSPSTSTYRYDDMIASFEVCGAGLRNGSICRRAPVNGRKRCEQHKGMRATFW